MLKLRPKPNVKQRLMVYIFWPSRLDVWHQHTWADVHCGHDMLMPSRTCSPWSTFFGYARIMSALYMFETSKNKFFHAGHHGEDDAGFLQQNVRSGISPDHTWASALWPLFWPFSFGLFSGFSSSLNSRFNLCFSLRFCPRFNSRVSPRFNSLFKLCFGQRGLELLQPCKPMMEKTTKGFLHYIRSFISTFLFQLTFCIRHIHTWMVGFISYHWNWLFLVITILILIYFTEATSKRDATAGRELFLLDNTTFNLQVSIHYFQVEHEMINFLFFRTKSKFWQRWNLLKRVFKLLSSNAEELKSFKRFCLWLLGWSDKCMFLVSNLETTLQLVFSKYVANYIEDNLMFNANQVTLLLLIITLTIIFKHENKQLFFSYRANSFRGQ